MYRALHFFRYGDPDGNGKKDTFGWSPDIGHWSMFFAEVFAANNVLPFDFMQRNGSIIWGGVLPEAKQTLATLRQWYQDELIDPDFPLDSQQLIGDRKFINGKTGYLYPVDYWREYDLTNPNSLYGRIRSFNPSAEITPAPPLRDTQGRRRGRTWGGAGHILQFGCQLEQEPEKVFRVLDMMETITRSESLYMTTRFGVRGSQWEYKPGKGMALIPPYENNKTLQEAELLVPQIGTCFFYPSTLEPAYDNQYMIPPIIEFDETYRKTAWGLMNVLGKSDVVPSAGRYLGDLRNYQTTVFLGIILGQRDLSDFDKFVDEWYRRGGDILTREANETYKTMRSIWKRVGATEDEL
jgi:putative aldouronate transport system substrate-binding protein